MFLQSVFFQAFRFFMFFVFLLSFQNVWFCREKSFFNYLDFSFFWFVQTMFFSCFPFVKCFLIFWVFAILVGSVVFSICSCFIFSCVVFYFIFHNFLLDCADVFLIFCVCLIWLGLFKLVAIDFSTCVSCFSFSDAFLHFSWFSDFYSFLFCSDAFWWWICAFGKNSCFLNTATSGNTAHYVTSHSCSKMMVTRPI